MDSQACSIPTQKNCAAMNPFEISEEVVTKEIEEMHSSYLEPLDANSLFNIAFNILNRSTLLVDKVIQQDDVKIPLEKVEDKTPKESFRVPMCTIKNIACKLFSCKDLAGERGHETTLTILKKLESYSWEAKLVLTLAAFAKEYGELLQLDELLTHEKLTKSLTGLKGSLILTDETTSGLSDDRRNALIELNDLVKLTLQVMEIIFETGGNKTEWLKPINVYWIIITVVACANQVTILTSNEGKKDIDLSLYHKKIREFKCDLLQHAIEKMRTETNEMIDQQEANYYELLKVRSRDPEEVILFLSGLFSTEDLSPCEELIDYSNHHNIKSVKISELKNKKVLFVFSRVEQSEISTSDMNILKRIQYEKIKKEHKEDQYAIVWVPIVDETRDTSEFDELLWSKEIQWYSVDSCRFHKGSLKFLKEEWNFEGHSICVVMDLALGKVQNLNAFYAMRLWGLEAFPYDEESVQRKLEEMSWINTIFPSEILNRCTLLANWVGSNEYIVIHGGMNAVWTKEIKDKLRFIQKETNMKIERFDINEQSSGVKEQFWRGVDTLFVKYYHAEYAKQQLQRLTSLKREKGWFMLNKGRTTMVVGPRETFLRAVEEIHLWKESITQRSLEVAFKEYHEKTYIAYEEGSVVIPPTKISGSLMIENPTADNGKTLLKQIDCPCCGQDMEMVRVTYKCTHSAKAIVREI